MDITDTALLYSGGAGNADPLASLGGIVSATGPALQLFTALASISGVTLLEVGGMEDGTLEFAYLGASKEVKIRPPNKDSGPYVAIGSLGDHNSVLTGGAGGGEGYAVIGVVEASLSGSNLADASTISLTNEVILPNVTAGQAATGATQYRCIFIKNNHATVGIVRVGVYLAYDTAGEDTISYAIDTDAGVGDGSTTGVPADIGTEDNGTPLLGLTFESETDPLLAQDFIGTIAPGQTIPIWIKRVVPQYVDESVIDNSFELGFKVYVDG